ncbi:hypothetical protein [Paludisphaera mucosa]|uniref:Helix-turn-helix domain-containing protein n=1 Tax=Paludisphaera mucosa TaxID=3030827 RepID=A0ABT6F6P7_9BACT|nr:hypothetical protein [Paludisphaera mucosa]MDG3003263.1 hypothetical protein [Paludisphaera mucosa]
MKAKPKAAKKPAAAPRPSPPPGVTTLLTSAEVAAALAVSIRKFRQMTATGLFPRGAGPPGMDPRWSTKTVNEWIARNYGG